MTQLSDWRNHLRLPRAAAVSIVFATLSWPLVAAQHNIETRVSLKVSGNDEIALSLQSNLMRELRAIPGVVLAQSDAALNVYVVALESKSELGHIPGLEVALMIAEPFDPEFVRASIEGYKGSISDKEWRTERENYEGLITMQSLIVLAGPPDATDMARRVASTVDVDHIEPRRQRLQRLLEVIDKRRESKKP